MSGAPEATACLVPITEGKDKNEEFDPSLSEDERRFYMKAYPSVDLVRERKVHCTVCKVHIGTAPSHESVIKMHPVLRVTHCTKCHDFYNSGEFSKGEDGSELYCRWCGQGGEVYCCSNCPYVFCKSCIGKNLSRGVVADIEQNENWSCFSCAPKILWPLRAQHWALMHFISKQKREIETKNISETEKKQQLATDRSTCCRLAKAKCGSMSDSLESLESETSRKSHGSTTSIKKTHKLPLPPGQLPASKRAKNSNDEVVCTPDLISMLEPDCQITMSPKPRTLQSSTASSPKVMTIQGSYNTPQAMPKSSVPPPLVLRNTSVQMRPVGTGPIVRRTVIGPRTPSPGTGTTPVYHTINGYRIDLNSAAQQDTFRLPNGKLIQVKRQGYNQNPSTLSNSWPQRSIISTQQQQTARPAQITQSNPHSGFQTITMQQPSASASTLPHQHPQMVRYQNTIIGNTTVTPPAPAVNSGGTQMRIINGTPTAPAPLSSVSNAAKPLMMRHIFPDNAIGQARSQLQDKVFNVMEMCQHLMGKVQTLTNSNAYKQARNYLDIKELYIHLSYLLTYAIGRLKGLQDKCLTDMRQLGFGNDADSLQNGQLAAGSDCVRYGMVDDIDLFNTGSNSFHNQVYEYRKSLHGNINNAGECDSKSLHTFDSSAIENSEDAGAWQRKAEEDSLIEPMMNDEDQDDDNECELENDEEMENYPLNDTNDGHYGGYKSSISSNFWRNTEEHMNREENSHAYDRKLTLLVEKYPSIWCARHPDYGNFEVTRKHWRVIASHFKRGENIKLRWKNIRKRYVRIERRTQQGKRFNGYFDKATNFLANRELPLEEWVDVEHCDNDLPANEYKKTGENSYRPACGMENKKSDLMLYPKKPIEIQSIDLKIINFVKGNPVLWRSSSDPESYKVDEQMRASLWMHLCKSMPTIKCSDIIDRWKHLYEMYKTFRLKCIKDKHILANLELKYSKYLAKLYFLYKIDESVLRNEDLYSEDGICADQNLSIHTKLQDMSDDKELLSQLAQVIRQYPILWDTKHIDYLDQFLREQSWQEIGKKLAHFQHKQASDDEDNEIEIVEPETDTITLDSDNETEEPIQTPKPSQQSLCADEPANKSGNPDVSGTNSSNSQEDVEFFSAAQSFLASMLEVDLSESDHTSTRTSPLGASDTTHKKQPRKKTTNKPNPTLLKQKEILERERLEELKRSDLKLKMKCAIELKKAEEEYPFAKHMLNESSADQNKEPQKQSNDTENEIEVNETENTDGLNALGVLSSAKSDNSTVNSVSSMDRINESEQSDTLNKKSGNIPESKNRESVADEVANNIEWKENNELAEFSMENITDVSEILTTRTEDREDETEKQQGISDICQLSISVANDDTEYEKQKKKTEQKDEMQEIEEKEQKEEKEQSNPEEETVKTDTITINALQENEFIKNGHVKKSNATDEEEITGLQNEVDKSLDALQTVEMPDMEKLQELAPESEYNLKLNATDEEEITGLQNEVDKSLDALKTVEMPDMEKLQELAPESESDNNLKLKIVDSNNSPTEIVDKAKSDKETFDENIFTGI